nr:LptF/LptG family permease [Arenimonas sp.]
MNAFGLMDRYLARNVLVSTLAVWAVLLGFDVIGAFAGEMGSVGKGSYTISHAALYIFFTIPRRLYVKDSSQLLPGHGGVLDRID